MNLPLLMSRIISGKLVKEDLDLDNIGDLLRAKTDQYHLSEMLSLCDDIMEISDTFGRTALMLAAKYGRLDCISILLEAGADIVAEQLLASCDEENRIPLMFSLKRRHIQCVTKLLEVGYTKEQLQSIDRFGNNILMYAISAGELPYIFEKIRSFGIVSEQIMATNHYGYTPLMIACMKGLHEYLPILLDVGSKKQQLVAKNDEEMSAIVLAALHGNISCVFELLKYEPSIQDLDNALLRLCLLLDTKTLLWRKNVHGYTEISSGDFVIKCIKKMLSLGAKLPKTGVNKQVYDDALIVLWRIIRDVAHTIVSRSEEVENIYRATGSISGAPSIQMEKSLLEMDRVPVIQWPNIQEMVCKALQPIDKNLINRAIVDLVLSKQTF